MSYSLPRHSTTVTLRYIYKGKHTRKSLQTQRQTSSLNVFIKININTHEHLNNKQSPANFGELSSLFFCFYGITKSLSGQRQQLSLTVTFFISDAVKMLDRPLLGKIDVEDG